MLRGLTVFVGDDSDLPGAPRTSVLMSRSRFLFNFMLLLALLYWIPQVGLKIVRGRLRLTRKLSRGVTPLTRRVKFCSCRTRVSRRRTRRGCRRMTVSRVRRRKFTFRLIRLTLIVVPLVSLVLIGWS